MQLNGSPEPVFDFDDDRTWFQVMLPIHPNFIQRQPLVVDLNGVTWDITGIDRLLNEILDKVGIPQTGGIAGDIVKSVANADSQVDDTGRDVAGGIAGAKANGKAGDIAEFILIADNHAFDAIDRIAGDIAGDIAGGIAGGIATKMIYVLELGKLPIDRKEIMSAIGLVNNVKNFNTYIQPLVAINWLTMTIPNKPTSPKQQYLTTLKGRLILEFLKHKTK